VGYACYGIIVSHKLVRIGRLPPRMASASAGGLGGRGTLYTMTPVLYFPGKNIAHLHIKEEHSSALSFCMASCNYYCYSFF